MVGRCIFYWKSPFLGDEFVRFRGCNCVFAWRNYTVFLNKAEQWTSPPCSPFSAYRRFRISKTSSTFDRPISCKAVSTGKPLTVDATWLWVTRWLKHMRFIHLKMDLWRISIATLVIIAWNNAMYSLNRCCLQYPTYGHLNTIGDYCTPNLSPNISNGICNLWTQFDMLKNI